MKVKRGGGEEEKGKGNRGAGRKLREHVMSEENKRDGKQRARLKGLRERETSRKQGQVT